MKSRVWPERSEYPSKDVRAVSATRKRRRMDLQSWTRSASRSGWPRMFKAYFLPARRKMPLGRRSPIRNAGCGLPRHRLRGAQIAPGLGYKLCSVGSPHLMGGRRVDSFRAVQTIYECPDCRRNTAWHQAWARTIGASTGEQIPRVKAATLRRPCGSLGDEKGRPERRPYAWRRWDIVSTGDDTAAARPAPAL